MNSQKGKSIPCTVNHVLEEAIWSDETNLARLYVKSENVLQTILPGQHSGFVSLTISSRCQ